ncbi:nitroreductase family protein [Natronorubrum bangense]|uniref:Nitroreductase n=2 Tax=Natronorubrum bangense TaxID=61858 RepID=L9W6K5_9EURY|nr:nitroreductase family protein [Natronorubrum bangense]ELY44906.1 nitroreductase [Natronorubrum bangense JCM 10635]QCC55005.1 nitroreductase [Natronorubrum bangense]
MQETVPTRRELDEDVADHRSPDYDIDPLFVNRWSPRAMTGEPLEEAEFLPLFEAARWAPSAYNNQHWRFVYATREDDEWETFVSLLSEGNAWAANAGVLAVILSKTTFDHNGEPAPVHSFDTGAAWENLALEGARRGLAVHGLAGFDYERAAEELDVPEEFAVEAMFAVGERASPETLPEELQEREQPSGRKPLSEIVFQGRFE